MVEKSPWPLIGSFSSLLLVLSILTWVKGEVQIYFLFFCSFPLILSSIQWWRDVIREGTMKGDHTFEVCKGLCLGFLLFILSEVMFFFSFFFGYFFTALNPDPSIGSVWPPFGIQTVSFLGVPLSNTIILLSSGISITWAHHSILCGKKKEFTISLVITIFLALMFIFFQYFEYFEMSFSISDSSFGSFFFILTGFHGLHVIVGTIFIFTSFLRGIFDHFSKIHHLGFEFSAWYWHFVDVVWLFLYVVVYWWGS